MSRVTAKVVVVVLALTSDRGYFTPVRLEVEDKNGVCFVQ